MTLLTSQSAGIMVYRVPRHQCSTGPTLEMNMNALSWTKTSAEDMQQPLFRPFPYILTISQDTNTTDIYITRSSYIRNGNSTRFIDRYAANVVLRLSW